jgi:iron(III) transport system ATP-binding protein
VRVLGQEVVVRCRPDERPRAHAKICCRSPDLEPGGPDQEGVRVTVKRVVYQGGRARVELSCTDDPTLDLHLEQADPVTLQAGSEARVRIRTGWLIPGPRNAA